MNKQVQAPLLYVRDLHVAYGGIVAVKGIELKVYPGELVTLIGANGAGKTTTLQAICGLLPITKGSIVFQGENIVGQPAFKLLAKGLAMVLEGRGLFTRMTVLENLQMGAYLRNDDQGIAQDIEKMMTFFPRLRERAKQLAGTLSGGEQQMVAIGRALMSRPQLLLLDEPSMGLSPILVETVFEVIKHIKEEGVTTLLVEQNARLALGCAERGYVLDSGVMTKHGYAQDILNDPKVAQAYLGA